MELKSTTYNLDGAEYRVAYWQTGSASAEKALFCVHGLLGRSRDFDELIAALSEDFLCVAIDLPGRGQSCLLYTSPSPRDKRQSRMPSSA